MLTPYRPILALGVILGTLSACNNPPPAASIPPAEWTQPVEEPPVPAETTDESVADYIVGLIDALRASNNKLKRLDEWRAKVSE